MRKPYLEHLKDGKSLVTTYEARRAGFIALALEKNRRATPFVEMARSLKAAASKAKAPMDLMSISEIRPSLLTASGISDKAANHLEETDKQKAILGLIRTFLEPQVNFVEELVYRFLLTRGDTLGGSMRNVGGSLAQRQLSRAIISWLGARGEGYSWMDSRTKVWTSFSSDDADIDLHLRALSWRVKGKPRTLLYNLTVPMVRNNVDLCLFDCDSEQLLKGIFKNPAGYLALGELKGGIDPAGADEHWKTARTALVRIQSSFTKRKATPKMFFIGAAIETKMASEIWAMLKNGDLHNAANLTDQLQLASITRWICSL